MRTQTANLLRVASADEATLALEGLPEMHCGQSTHAAIEKLFKALIAEHGVRHRFIHDLDFLKRDVESLGETAPTLPIVLGSLNKYATVFRYDDDADMPPPLDREKCREAVRLVREYVTARVDALGQAPPAPPTPP